MRATNFALLVSLALATTAFGDVVASQPASFPGGFACACWTSSEAGGSGFQTWDDFTPSANGAINLVSWQGLYWDFQTPGNNPAAPGTTSWLIQFWSDNAGQPGAPLRTTTLPAATVTLLPVGISHDLGDPTPVYDFFAVLPSTFNVTAGTRYWFSVLSIQPGFNPLFSWTLGSGGDGSSIQYDTGAAAFATRAGDRAFTLSTAPEPATFAAFGAGLAALAGLRRRRVAK